MRISSCWLFLGVVVLGCGGGGGGGNDGPEPVDPTPSATVSAEPTATPSPFPEILLATGRSFRGSTEAPLVLRNDGDGWQEVSLSAAPPHTLLVGIVFSTPDIAWAFGMLGDQQTPVLLRTSDAGLTWTNVTASLPPNCPSIADMAFADSQTGYLAARAIFSGPRSFATRDGGATWQSIELPLSGLAGAYAVGTRGTAAELVAYDSNGLWVARLDDPALAPVFLAPSGGSRIAGPNSVSTVGLRGWIAVIRSTATLPHTATTIFTSTAPGEPWVEQVVEHETFELNAIDLRDPENGIAGGRGITPASTGLSPLALVTNADGTAWQLAPIAGVSEDATVVDVLRTRGDGAWAITTDTGVVGESAFLRSDDGGHSWHYEATPFEHDVRLTDLARNTELH